VTLGDDDLIQLGDSIVLTPEVNVISISVLDTFYWGNSLLTDLEPKIGPLQTTNYQITVVNEFGCVATDEVQIRVNKDRLVYVPNIFTPNGDGRNDILFVYGGQGVLRVKAFKMFNRWGELLHEAYNFQPEAPDSGWDGNFRGEVMNPGVFVYYAEVEFIDGRVELYKGDVTLMR